jgi:dTMP kinase
MSKGKYIVFEGIDGAGKSTLIEKLAYHLKSKNKNVYTTFEPTSNPLGSLIRHALGGRVKFSEETIAALFLADRLDHLQNETNGILKYINNGTTVIGDRYYLSSYAYHVPHVSLDWVVNANQVCADLIRPDITFFIDISVEESLKRITANRQELDMFENKDRLTKVRNNYYAAIQKVKDKENIIMIDGEQSPDQVFNQIIKHF